MNHTSAFAASTDPHESADPHLIRLIERCLSAHMLYPACERLLAYLIDAGTEGWPNTKRSRERLGREITNAMCEDDPIPVALRNIQRAGELEANTDRAFADVFASESQAKTQTGT